MLTNLKSNAALAFDGLFGPRYGFFELMEEARTRPAAIDAGPEAETAPVRDERSLAA